MTLEKTPPHIKIDERHHVEKPLLDQLDGLGWEVLDLDQKQAPGDTWCESFSEVVLEPVLREQLKVINPWLEDDQVEEVMKRLIASFPSTNLLDNNRHVLNLLLENTSVAENRKTGEKSPTVRYIDFTHRDHNRFIAVCQTGDIGIVIVNNMLLTGFDAPIEQVMYLDRVIVAHNLLQAIARVNRVAGAAKEKGFIVDYVGIGHHLKKAIRPEISAAATPARQGTGAQHGKG